MVLDGAVLGRSDHQVIQEVSVFTANEAIKTEYLPKRPRLEAPTVVVEMPAEPAPAAPAPEAPKEPIEKLEDALKPIETIPVKPDAEKSGGDE